MKVDICFHGGADWPVVAARLSQAESIGFDAAWTFEWLGNPFIPLTIAAKDRACSIALGTVAAYAFPRSPMVTAQIAWDLARQSGGRFMLGLDAQTAEFQTKSESSQAIDPIGKMREYLDSLRAIWRAFQYDERLRFRGKHYQFRLMAPFFNPGPIDHPEIPIFLSGADIEVYELAGEMCHGLHASVLHSQSYLRDKVLPALKRGLERADKAREAFQLAVPVLVFVRGRDTRGDCANDDMKKRMASIVSARSNYSFAAYHGWEESLDSLGQFGLSGRRDSLWRAIPDEILHEIAIVGETEQVAAAIHQRYSGIADRVCLIFDVWNPETIAQIVADLKGRLLGG